MDLLDNLKNLFYMKGRTYPIKYDELGQSARSRALELFGKGLKPIEVIEQVEISLRTAHRLP